MDKDAITLACEALQEQLKQIATANGYHTDSGQNTISEFAGILIDNNQQTPFIAIQPESTGQPQQATHKAKLDENLQLVVVVDATLGAAEQLRRSLADLRKCLTHAPFVRPLEGKAKEITLGQSTYDITDDSRYALAVLPVTLTIIENYEA